MSLFDRRGARADQTNSPPEAPTNSLKPESRGCEYRAPVPAPSAYQARRAQAGCERRKAACSAGTARRLIQHEDGCLHKPSGGVGGGEDALQLGHEHADECVQVAGVLQLVVPAELAAEHLRGHLEQLACGSTAQPLAGEKEGSPVSRLNG